MRRCAIPEMRHAIQRPMAVQAERRDVAHRREVEAPWRRLCSAALAAVASGALLCASPARADIERFPASANPEVFAVQKTLVEAWDIVDKVFVDPTGDDWRQDLRSHLLDAYKAKDADQAYNSISGMLEDLKDPYTRLVPPDEYASFRMDSKGEVQGVGLLIASDPSSGKIVVLAPLRGSPAEKAGIMPGDEVLSINGRSTRGLDGKEAAKSLRGKDGTTVSVKLARRTEEIPGVPARVEEKPVIKYKSVQMKREVVELNPVYYDNVEEAGMKLGYIKLTTFSNKSSDAIRNAVEQLDGDGVDAFVLDLRGNPGGLVQAGLDIARVWLDGPATIFHISGRNASAHSEVTLHDGVSSTEKPLVVLVNEESASASEILAGALHDNHRAKIIGDRTYGKGKIQNVFELQDGSALFVTVARYQTPDLDEIDGKGIVPDLGCFPDKVGPAPKGEGIGVQGPSVMEVKSMLEAELELDDCFVTAERFLNKSVTHRT